MSDFNPKTYKKRLDNAVQKCATAPNECEYVEKVYNAVHDKTAVEKNLLSKNKSYTVGDWFHESAFSNKCNLR